MRFKKLGILVVLAHAILCNPEVYCGEGLFDSTKGATHSFLPIMEVSSDALRTVDESATSAAGMLLWAMKDNQPYILLGLRDDNRSWSNMGGGSESFDEMLYVTAAREVKEETMGLYSFAPEQVAQMPYFDLQNKNIFYRMYVAQCFNFISSDIFSKRLELATGASHEYVRFEWLTLDNFLNVVKEQVSLGNVNSEGIAYPLIEDFVSILRENNSLSKFESFLRRSINDTSFRRGDVKTSNLSDTIAQNVIVKRMSILRRDVSWFEKLISFGGHFMDLFLRQTNDLGLDTLTPSQSIMKLVLGNEYQLGQDKLNLETLQNISSPKIDKEGLDSLVKLLDFERKEYLKENFVVYHGLKGDLLFFYRYVSAINSLITGKDMLNSSLGLRSNQLFSISPLTNKPYETAHEVFNTLRTTKHYGNGMESIFLFVNPMLTLNSLYSNTTTSSLALFSENRSICANRVKSYLLEMMILQGMSLEYAEQCYNEFYSLYEQFYGNKDNNGGILAISIPKNLVDTHLSLSGKELAEDDKFSKMVEAVQEKARNLDPNQGSFKNIPWDKQSEIRDMTYAARLYLDPLKSFNTFSIWHYNPSDEEKAVLDDAFDKMVSLHAMRLIRSRSNPLKNTTISFGLEDHLVNRFLSEYNRLTGENLNFANNTKMLLPALLENNNSDIFASVLNGEKISPTPELQKAFFVSVWINENYDVIEWLRPHLDRFVNMGDFLKDEDKLYIVGRLIDETFYLLKEIDSKGEKGPRLNNFIYNVMREYASVIKNFKRKNSQVLKNRDFISKFDKSLQADASEDLINEVFVEPANREKTLSWFSTPENFVHFIRFYWQNDNAKVKDFVKNYVLEKNVGEPFLKNYKFKDWVKREIELNGFGNKGSSFQKENIKIIKELLDI